jgi:hypothetical protein
MSKIKQGIATNVIEVFRESGLKLKIDGSARSFEKDLLKFITMNFKK